MEEDEREGLCLSDCLYCCSAQRTEALNQKVRDRKRTSIPAVKISSKSTCLRNLGYTSLQVSE